MEGLIVLVLIAVVCAIVTGIAGGVVMLAWNAVLPALFHLPVISFLQACALWVLVGSLVGFVKGNSK